MSGNAGGPSEATSVVAGPGQDASTRPGEAAASTRKMEYWREMRNLIIHEDNLVNHRFSWLLTYEGFLMGGFFIMQSALLSNKIHASGVIAAEVFLTLIMLASMWICFVTGQTISVAYRQTAMVYRTWITRYPEEEWTRSLVPRWFWPFSKDGHDNPIVPPVKSDFPPLLGKFSYHSLGRTVRIPFILCLINFLAALACVGIAWYAHAHSAELYAQPATSVAATATTSAGPAAHSTAPATRGLPELTAPKATAAHVQSH